MNLDHLNNSDNLRPQLRDGERLLWAGGPRQGWVLRPTDKLIIPFSIIWAGFALFWELAVITSGGPFFFMIFGIPFVLMGLYITVGRFYLDSKVRARTQYGLTDTRVLVSSGRSGSASLTTIPLDALQTISMTEVGDGSGTISFGGGLPVGHFYAGFHLPGMSGFLPTQFELIDDVRTVHDQILRAKQGARQ